MVTLMLLHGLAEKSTLNNGENRSQSVFDIPRATGPWSVQQVKYKGPIKKGWIVVIKKDNAYIKDIYSWKTY